MAADAEGTAASLTEAQIAYHAHASTRPGGPFRTSSTHYAAALRAAHDQHSTPDDLVDADVPSAVHEEGGVAAFPAPGQGVVPSYEGIGAATSGGAKKSRPSGMSLGDLGRSKSWNEQDRKHVLQAHLMEKVEGDAGYDSGSEGRAVGPA